MTRGALALVTLLVLAAGGVGAARAAVKRGAQASPACFGAAAHDSQEPCRNPALRLASQPSPASALITPNYPCTPEGEGEGDFGDRAAGALVICAFATNPERATRTVALVGDSHAMAWRAAVAGMAKALGWRALDMTRSHCAFSFAAKALKESERAGCLAFNRRVIDWLGRHPAVTTVFAVHETGGTPVLTAPGEDEFETQVAGYEQAWVSLPASVGHLVAIRDNPGLRKFGHTGECVRSAQKAGRPPGPACAQPRARSLRRDAAAVAAQRLNLSRFAVADLSRIMCDRRRCFPVIGGALVYKDGHHLTRVFSDSLGPILERRVRELMAGW